MAVDSDDVMTDGRYYRLERLVGQGFVKSTPNI